MTTAQQEPAETRAAASAGKAAEGAKDGKLDPAAAAAALAFAVRSAEQAASIAQGESAGTKAIPETVSAPRASNPPAWRRYAAQAATIAVAAALGWSAASYAGWRARREPAPVPAWADGLGNAIRQNEQDLARLAGDVRALKGLVEALTDNLDTARSETASQLRPIGEGLDRVERSGAETAAKLAETAAAVMARDAGAQELAARLQRETAEVSASLNAIAVRLAAIEQRAATGSALSTAPERPAASAAPMADGPGQTASVPEAKPAKQPPVEGWILHDVYDGVALVESRSGRLHEVAAGHVLPTLGRVEAIERRGKAWVVITTKGVIGAERWQ
jgi:hypothetical protein